MEEKENEALTKGDKKERMITQFFQQNDQECNGQLQQGDM